MAEFLSTLWDLIENAGQGDEGALKEFVYRYRPAVEAYIRRKGLKAEAEDLAQDVFMILFRDGLLLKVDPMKGLFRSYLMTITKHVISYQVRKMKTQKRGSGRVQSLGEIDVADSKTDSEFDREWIMLLVRRAMTQLAKNHPNYYEVLRLFVFEESTYDDIVEKLGLTHQSVKHAINRGRKKLATFIKEEVQEYCTTHDELLEEIEYLSQFFNF